MTVEPDISIIADLWEVIEERARTLPEGSYVASVLTHRKGVDKALEKVGEECIEFIIAVKNGAEERTVSEAADLLFHFLLALKASGTPFSEVLKTIEERRSGTQE